MNYTKKSWSVEEENEMLGSLRRRETFEKIAQKHGRTPNAIKLRFGLVCKKEIGSASKSMEGICQEYNLTEEQVSRCINDLENIQKKDTKPTTSSFDPADISIIKEEVLLINEKLEKVYRNIKKLMEMKVKKIKKSNN